MIKNGKLELIIDDKSYEITVDNSCNILGELTANFPLSGEVVNVQGEIYFLTELTIPYSSNEATDEFEVGDLAYWISPDGSMKAIALFYGNTVYKDGRKPRAYSPCIKFGSLKGIKPEELKKVKNNIPISLNLLKK